MEARRFVAPFVGRDAELAELVAAVGAATAHGQLYLLAGEPGIGKTRLARELTERARRRGARVCWGRCWEGDGAPSFWPWLQILRALVAEIPTDELAARLGRGVAEVAELVPEIHDRLPDVPVPEALEPAQQRFRLLDAISGFLKRCASAAEPLVLVLDDLHVADDLTLSLLHLVAREVAAAPVIVIGTYRPAEALSREGLARGLGALVREARRFDLQRLTAQEVQRYLETILPFVPDRDLIDAVYSRTEGNPFFLGEVAHLLQARRPGDRAAPLALPEEVHAAVRVRLDGFSREARRVLRLAAAIGREFDEGILARTAGLDPERVAGHLEDARRIDVVRLDDAASGRHRFSHVLVRDALYGEIERRERPSVHHRIARVLEEQAERTGSADLPGLAHHFAAAGEDERPRAIDYALRAAGEARRRLAFEDAVRHYRAALSLLEAIPEDTEKRVSVQIELAEALWWAGRPEAARAAFVRVARLARERQAAGEPDAPALLARAALGFGGPGIGGTLEAGGSVNQQLVSLLEEALDVVGEDQPALRSRLLGRLATALFYTGSNERRIALSEEAVAEARRSNDRAALASSLLRHHYGSWSRDALYQRLANAEELMQLTRELGDRQTALAIRAFRVPDLFEIGDPNHALREIEEHARLTEELRHPFHRFCSLRLRSGAAIFEGRFSEGEALAHQALAAGQRVDEWGAYTTYSAQMALICHIKRDFHPMERTIREAMRFEREIPAWRVGMAALHYYAGRHDAAAQELEPLADEDFAGLPDDFVWLLAVSILSDICAGIADTGRTRILYSLLLPYRDRCVVQGMTGAVGSVERELGTLATALGRWPDAVEHFERAVQRNARMRAAPALAHARLGLARALLQSPTPEPARAESLLDAAQEGARSMGMSGVLREAQELRESGRSRPVGERPRPATENRIRREAAGWMVVFNGESSLLKDRKGVAYIVELLRHPGREVHVADLVLIRGDSTARYIQEASLAESSQPDHEARHAYRKRLQDLQEELHDADADHDLGRASGLRREIASLSDELARAYGIGRRRHTGDAVEKMRKAVLSAIRHSLTSIERAHPALGRHLRNSVKTGTVCTYRPETDVVWHVES